MLVNVLADWGAYEVSAMDLYTDMFCLGEGYLQQENEPPGEYKANPLGYYKDDIKRPGHYRILFEDTFADVLTELQQAKAFAIINGITYFGRRNKQDHASKMFAMIFDLDGVTDECLTNFLSGASPKIGAYPEPNYIVLSGHGVHLYYLFDKPINLYPYIKTQLKELKYALTQKIWNKYTSTIDKPQVQGINQGFRVIGSKTKDGAPESVARAFRYRVDPYTLEELCEYVPESSRVNQQKLWRETKYTIEEAKTKFPEWYQRVVVKKNYERSYWQISEKVHGDNPYALYDWWYDKIRAGATYGHRYFSIMCLAIYAVKCQVPYERLEQDAYDLIPFLDGLNPSEPFTIDDCKSALECYDLRYSTFPIDDIVKLSGIAIEKNKRNGRKQDVHLFLARNQKQALKMVGELKQEGRPKGSGTAENKVVQWRLEHPKERKIDCHRDTGLSRVTIDKWWDSGIDE